MRFAVCVFAVLLVSRYSAAADGSAALCLRAPKWYVHGLRLFAEDLRNGPKVYALIDAKGASSEDVIQTIKLDKTSMFAGAFDGDGYRFCWNRRVGDVAGLTLRFAFGSTSGVDELMPFGATYKMSSGDFRDEGDDFGGMRSKVLLRPVVLNAPAEFALRFLAPDSGKCRQNVSDEVVFTSDAKDAVVNGVKRNLLRQRIEALRHENQELDATIKVLGNEIDIANNTQATIVAIQSALVVSDASSQLVKSTLEEAKGRVASLSNRVRAAENLRRLAGLQIRACETDLMPLDNSALNSVVTSVRSALAEEGVGQ